MKLNNGNAHPFTSTIAGGFLVLSFLSCIVFFAVDRSMCVRSMIVNAVTVLALSLFPAVSETIT